MSVISGLVIESSNMRPRDDTNLFFHTINISHTSHPS